MLPLHAPPPVGSMDSHLKMTSLLGQQVANQPIGGSCSEHFSALP